MLNIKHISFYPSLPQNERGYRLTAKNSDIANNSHRFFFNAFALS